MATYLVTGAAGFIGAKLAERLLHGGHQVVTVDNLSTGQRANVPTGVTFIKGNVQDQGIIDRLYAYDFAAIFHIAGQSSGEVSFDNPVYDLQTNTQSTLQLLKLCLETNCSKFIYASSMSVYGDVKDLPVREEEVPQPKSFYGVGKLASEHYLSIYAKLGIATAALRLFNVYGPGQNLQNMRQGMVSIFLAQALRDRHIHVKGSADRFRDFVFIDDIVEAFLQSANTIETGKHYLMNVCTERKITVGELVDQIIHQVGTPVSQVYEGSTPGDQFGIYGSADQIRQLIGWEPKTTFEEGMEAMVKWAINQQR